MLHSPILASKTRCRTRSLTEQMEEFEMLLPCLFSTHGPFLYRCSHVRRLQTDDENEIYYTGLLISQNAEEQLAYQRQLFIALDS